MDATLGDLMHAVANDPDIAAQLRAREIKLYGLNPDASDDVISSARTNDEWRRKQAIALGLNPDPAISPWEVIGQTKKDNDASIRADVG
jgi:hypothetical protein